MKQNGSACNILVDIAYYSRCTTRTTIRYKLPYNNLDGYDVSKFVTSKKKNPALLGIYLSSKK